MPGQVTRADLVEQLEDLGSRYRAFSDDRRFVMWFLYAYLVEDEAAAAAAVLGGPGDRGVDGVFVDERSKGVFVVQGKFRERVGVHTEGRSDVMSFAALADPLLGTRADFDELIDGIDPAVGERLAEARERLKRRNYTLHLYYVTLGRCSPGLRTEADNSARPAELIILDGRQVLGILNDYLDGVAPPIRMLDLPIEAAQASGTSQRFDPESEIESWVFSMSGDKVGDLFEQAGKRLFARNIRGFLGNTKINAAMEETLTGRPGYFWYFNNGVTIVCNEAQKIGQSGREVLRVENPQVINGQQTTRVLHAKRRSARRASVLVRVIKVPPDPDGADRRFDELVSTIVEATNWQNAIRPSDLMSNDRQQVLIERELRKLGYQYLRKRETKREARRASRGQYRFLVKKEELAQAVGACELDPAVVRAGREGLFDAPYYQAVFGSSSASEYLNRYWMMRHVSRQARGYPDRGYAKWVVLHFVWNNLAVEVERQSERFRRASESADYDVLHPLDRAADAAFRGALSYWRANRGRGPTAIDVSSYFKRRGLHDGLDRFWRRAPRGTRDQFSGGRRRFLAALRAYEL